MGKSKAAKNIAKQAAAKKAARKKAKRAAKKLSNGTTIDAQDVERIINKVDKEIAEEATEQTVKKGIAKTSFSPNYKDATNFKLSNGVKVSAVKNDSYWNPKIQGANKIANSRKVQREISNDVTTRLNTRRNTLTAEDYKKLKTSNIGMATNKVARDELKKSMPNLNRSLGEKYENVSNFNINRQPKKITVPESVSKIVQTGVGAGLLFTMFDRRGNQSNSELYGQSTPYGGGY